MTNGGLSNKGKNLPPVKADIKRVNQQIISNNNS
jgi:hypothetical protein